jgi:hypothetical protein
MEVFQERPDTVSAPIDQVSLLSLSNMILLCFDTLLSHVQGGFEFALAQKQRERK